MHIAISLTALVAFCVATAVADQPAPAADVAAAKAQLSTAEAAILAFYPAVAKAKGVEGQAMLKRRRTPPAAR